MCGIKKPHRRPLPLTNQVFVLFYRSMRNLYLLILAAVLIAACGTPTSKPTAIISDSARAASFVAHFLRWYAGKYDSLNNFNLVNTHEEEDSAWNTLNVAETKRYLNALRASGYFTERFLAEKEAYFRHCDSFFNAKKEHIRSPTGFDFDLVLSSSQTEELLADSVDPSIKVSFPSVIFDKCLVFTLKCAGDTCRVDKIHYRVDPDEFTDLVYVPGADSTDPAIREIQKQVQQIRTDTVKYRVVDNDIDGESTEGGDDTFYYAGNQLRKATVEFFGETGKWGMVYYFAQGKMIFAIGRNTRYTKPFYIDNYDIGMIKTDRYYFQNGRLFRCIDEKGKLVAKGLFPAKLRELYTEDSVFLHTFSQ